MVPDINLVRDSAKKKKKVTHGLLRPVAIKAIEHFYNKLEEDINNQLLEGRFANSKIDYWLVRNYMELNSPIEMSNDDYFKILDAVFSRVEIFYTLAGYTVFIDKHVGVKSNYNAYYESYYSCEIGF